MSLSSQQEADLLLCQWQELRTFDPEERIERLFSDFFQPPIELDLKYDDALRAVAMEMAT